MAKAKVSVTVDSVLLQRCDRAARGASRSEVFERALKGWLRHERETRLEEDVERYYTSLGEAEQAEDAAWAGLGPRVLGETWK